MEKNDGGPAYPVFTVNRDTPYMECGMSLRDYFAANCPITLTEMMTSLADGSEKSDVVIQAYGLLRYQYADAMLAAREAK